LPGQAEQPFERTLGAVPLDGERVEFRVWAPNATTVHVRVGGATHALEPAGDGVCEAAVPARAGDEYVYVLDEEREPPDPCSRSQPHGVRGPSAVVDVQALGLAQLPRLPLAELVIYELHVGTFSSEGTFAAAIPYLPELRALGVTAIEVMPIATFPGNRGWGYDGVYTYAPHPVYGGPEGFAQLVDAAHREGLRVFLDVVYNHIGPGADAVGAFGPYFTDKHTTFWGKAIDYSQPAVREWAIQNAQMWTRGYGVDGLRLDAVQTVFDDSPTHVLTELKQRVDATIVSEMTFDDWRPIEEWGHDAQWADRSHHELHVLLTDEHDGYYEGFGSLEGLVEDLRGRGHPPEQLVVFAQNHDQVGNRAQGDRLPPDDLRVAAAVTLFSLCTPLVFQGEEYAEPNPFQFFTDHIDPAVAESTRRGRKEEFEKFLGFGGEVPDPQADETFLRSKLSRRADAVHRAFYERLLQLRRELPRELAARVDGRVLTLRRGDVELVADFGAKTVELRDA
jgi:maltooligosyltrehalose trehalohydrolase